MAKYKNGQKVDIGDGDIWRIIDVEGDLIEIESIGSNEYKALFVDESEIVRLVEK